MYTLKNPRMLVEIAEPNAECRTSRFDRAGFVTRVRLDGKYEFLGQEDMLDGSPSSGGMGLCSEIVCDPLSAEVAVGEKFPKFGVGLLTKETEEPYYFMNSYPCEDYPVGVAETRNQISFGSGNVACGGYAMEQRKVITLEDTTLTIAYEFINTGSKELTFEEYCHNFITLNRKKVNRDYRLEIPCLEIPAGEIKTLDICTPFYSDGSSLSKSEESMVFALYAFGKEQMKPVDTYQWKLTDLKEGLVVTETDDFTVDKVTVWSVGDVISPEMFFKATLKPGEKACWSRKYTFEKQ
ncbi:MAG: hypothetical protein MJ114_03175 [Acetatifactor sp.]|nr:hypothetical protein [Acetatifactor sp.]